MPNLLDTICHLVSGIAVRSSKAEQAGFTLVEILLALLMFGIISGVIFASFSAVVDGVEQSQESSEFYRVGRAVLQLMSQEVAAAMQVEGDDRTTMQGEDSERNGQPRDRLDFVLIPYRRFAQDVPSGDLCDVSYYIDDNDEGNATLFREEDCTLDSERQEGGTKLELTDAAVGLNVTFFDATDSYDEWNAADRNNQLPCRVQLALTLQQPSKDAKDAKSFITTVALPMRGTCEP